MAEEAQYMHSVNGWEKIDTAIVANEQQVGHLVSSLGELRTMGQSARSLYAQHAALTALKQQIWKELQEAIRNGNAILKFLREGVRAHYGKESDKLIEFGVQPFRGVARKPAPKPELPEAPSPETLTPDPVK
jgi:hypothetical protein